MSEANITLLIQSVSGVLLAIVGLGTTIAAIFAVKAKNKGDDNAIKLDAVHVHLGEQDKAIASTHTILTKMADAEPTPVVIVDAAKMGGDKSKLQPASGGQA
jgi:hypothetical protein